ncbi:MAG: DUF3667 domain-containing protein [Pseudomonadota bacterium]
MTSELEFIGAASAGAVARDIDGDGYLDGPCPNCGTLLTAEYCASCGQSAKDLHRPFVTLITDALGDVFAFDSRLARTLPPLLFQPGRMTRSYLDGKRARYVPPFRMFLIASVVFFLVIFSIGERQDWLQGDDLTMEPARQAISAVQIDGVSLGERDGFEDVFNEEGELDPEAAGRFLDSLSDVEGLETEADRAEMLNVINGMNDFTASRTELFNAVQKWAPRLSFLLLPFYVLSLTILHFWVRRIYVYDHVIVALHFQTFLYIAATIAVLFSFSSPGAAWAVFGLSVPIYLYRLMRVSYATSRILTLFRTFGLLISSVIAMTLLVVAVSLVGANEVGLLNWDDINFDVGENSVFIGPTLEGSAPIEKMDIEPFHKTSAE